VPLRPPALQSASRHNRPGLLGLIARLAEWDVLLAWDSARLARNVEDLGWIRNRLRSAKKTAVFVQTGLDLFNVGSKVMGVFDEEYGRSCAPTRSTGS
jgi:DNA invertase Pin-like site-specific DNA recombinase